MTEEKPVYSQRYRAYVLLVLTGVYTFNFIDRQILVIIQDSIKAEMGLSDGQMGLLHGFSFAIFYCLLGIPIARMADKSNRRNIVALSLAVWSGMTAISGSVVYYWQLLLARIGVGVGEAGGSPPAHSIVSDYFPAQQRATALSIYSVGIYIGILAGYSLGGWIDQTYGWRMAFLALGLPGIAYALLLLLTVKEPPKGHSDVGTLKDDNEVPFKDVINTLLSKKTFVFLALACGLHTFGNYGVGNWFAPFLGRVHGMPKGEIGTYLGLCAGFGGILGTFGGGYLADKLGKRDIRWYMWLPVIAEILTFWPNYVQFFTDNVNTALICHFITAFLTAIYLGPCIAVTHNLVGAKMRALSSAVLFLVLNIIGLGLGPYIVGALSDYFTPTYGSESLRYAFTITFLTGAIALYLFYRASQEYPKEALVAQVSGTKAPVVDAEMGAILNIVFGVFLLFLVGLFFLQAGIAGVAVMSMASWILGIVAILFVAGLGLTTRGIMKGN